MSTKKTIATIIGVLLMFGCQFLPPVFGLTPLGMQVAGIFIGTILLWMFVSVTWPSILCIIALILSPAVHVFQRPVGLYGGLDHFLCAFQLHGDLYPGPDRLPQALRGLVRHPALGAEEPLAVFGAAVSGSPGHRFLYVSHPGPLSSACPLQSRSSRN